MYLSALDFLACPRCENDQTFALEVAEQAGDDVITGSLDCPACCAHFPILGGVPRFAGTDAEEFDNFAFQWNKWQAIQIDRLAGHTLSED